MAMTACPWEVRVADGCHAAPLGPLISRHRTLRAAIKRARRSDRLQVEHCDHNAIVYSNPQRGCPRLGAGRFGRGVQPGEPSLDWAVRQATALAEKILRPEDLR